MNRIKHVEFAGRDGRALEEFYGELFGWKPERTEAGGSPYGYVRMGHGLTAGIRHEPEGRAEVVVYVEVPDVEAAVARATELGADVRIPPMRAGELHFALLVDPEGNPFGVTEARDR